MVHRILLSFLVIGLGVIALRSSYIYAQIRGPISGDTFRTYTDEEVVQLVNRLNSEAQIALSPNQSCPDDEDFSVRGCNFREMCELVEPNQGSRILYESPDGGRILNISASQHLDGLETCLKTLPVTGGSEDSDMRRELRLMEVVNSAGKGEVLAQVRENILRNFVNSNIPHEDFGYSSRDEIEAEIRRAENELSVSSGQVVSLGEEVRSAYIDYVANDIGLNRVAKMDRYFEDLETNQLASLIDDPLYSPGDFLLELPDEATQARLARGHQRTSDTLQRVKNRVVTILQERAERDPSKSETLERMIEKVRGIELIPEEESNYSKCSIPNGFYNRFLNRIQICSQYYEAPEFALVHILAHEVGHAVDSCSLLLQGLPDSTGNNQSINFDEHPLATVRDCLETSDSLGLVSFDTEDRLKWVNRQINDYESRGFSEENSQQLRSLQRDKRTLESEKFSCRDYIESEGQFDQGIADWVAAEVIAKEVEGLGATEARRAVLEAGSHYLRECRQGSSNSLAEWAQEKMNDLGCGENGRRGGGMGGAMNYQGGRANYMRLGSYYDSLVGYWSLTHPSSSQRINRIFLANPTIQNSMNCSSEVRYCE